MMDFTTLAIRDAYSDRHVDMSRYTCVTLMATVNEANEHAVWCALNLEPLIPGHVPGSWSQSLADEAAVELEIRGHRDYHSIGGCSHCKASV